MTTVQIIPKSCISNNDRQKQLCECEKNILMFIKQKENWENHLAQVADQTASYNRWKNYHADWQNKRGDFGKYANIGTDRDQFTVQWGYPGWDTHNTCKECASGKWGWGNGSKFGGGAWCDGDGKNRDYTDSFYDYGTKDNKAWGELDIWGRKWWTCRKSESGKQKELNQWIDAEPLTDPINPNQKWVIAKNNTVTDSSNFSLNSKTKNIPEIDTRLHPEIQLGMCCLNIFPDIKNKIEQNNKLDDGSQYAINYTNIDTNECLTRIKEDYENENIKIHSTPAPAKQTIKQDNEENKENENLKVPKTKKKYKQSALSNKTIPIGLFVLLILLSLLISSFLSMLSK